MIFVICAEQTGAYTLKLKRGKNHSSDSGKQSRMPNFNITNESLFY
jgi:hypothetical protein